eukprot:6997-Pyramimonas_sp.AAC.1
MWLAYAPPWMHRPVLQVGLTARTYAIKCQHTNKQWTTPKRKTKDDTTSTSTSGRAPIIKAANTIILLSAASLAW